MEGLTAINTIEQVAAYLGVSCSTIWRLINKGELRKIKALGKVRITKTAVEEMINK